MRRGLRGLSYFEAERWFFGLDFYSFGYRILGSYSVYYFCI